MSETRFTPGPWRVEYSLESAYVRANCDVCAAKGLTEPIGIAHIYEIGGGDDHPNHANANARLIAAAPELYEALGPVKRGAQEADYYCPDDVPEDHVVLISMTIGELRAARAALSKAQPEGK